MQNFLEIAVRQEISSHRSLRELLDYTSVNQNAGVMEPLK